MFASLQVCRFAGFKICASIVLDFYDGLLHTAYVKLFTGYCSLVIILAAWTFKS